MARGAQADVKAPERDRRAIARHCTTRGDRAVDRGAIERRACA